jgi:hypothetical protein
VARNPLIKLVLPLRIELRTSPLPRDGTSRKGADLLAFRAADTRNSPGTGWCSGDISVPAIFCKIVVQGAFLRQRLRKV